MRSTNRAIVGLVFAVPAVGRPSRHDSTETCIGDCQIAESRGDSTPACPSRDSGFDSGASSFVSPGQLDELVPRGAKCSLSEQAGEL